MQTVGIYEFDSKDVIGHGAFAMVYKGREKKNPSKTVAIKAITKKNISKQSLLEKEIKILELLTELHHENVVALLHYEDLHHHLYLVMEHCKGGDLADYLSLKGTLSEDTIRLFLIQLAGAMKLFADKGIMHRDLKPQNILITYDVPNPQPSQIKLKIADFGFARFMKDGVMAATLCGSPMYMAPEVILAAKYDGKADLWSLGTIVFQCLTGKAPFQANTPHALKQIYDTTINLVPKIPHGTSPELTDLLLRLLTRNATERIDFKDLYNHKFLKREELQKTSSPLQADMPLPISTPPTSPSSKPVRIISAPQPKTFSESLRSAKIALSSSPEDDYVIVSRNMPDLSTESVDLEKQLKTGVRTSPLPCGPSASPVRPSFLPVSEPVPVPTMREVYARMTNESGDSSTSAKTSNVPRSQPISMKRSENRPFQYENFDLDSLPPPKRLIGTPPGRKRSTSGSSLSETPPLAMFCSPSPVARTAPINSPLRRSGAASPPYFNGSLARMPLLSSPNFNNENNNLNRSPGYCTRAVTLPEISEMRNYDSANNGYDSEPMMFFAPDLSEETLLEKEHNEALAKVNFVLALSNCILDLAALRTAPIGALHDSMHVSTQVKNELVIRTERFVLLIRALQLMASALSLADNQMKAGTLRPSTAVKTVISSLNSLFKSTLTECKQMKSAELINKMTEITADKLLYDHAIQICQGAALDELFDNPSHCLGRYQTAQILLHSLVLHASQQDKELLMKYKEAVEKRLEVLQQKSLTHTNDPAFVNF